MITEMASETSIFSIRTTAALMLPAVNRTAQTMTHSHFHFDSAKTSKLSRNRNSKSIPLLNSFMAEFLYVGL
jgi:hypothetical protein